LLALGASITTRDDTPGLAIGLVRGGQVVLQQGFGSRRNDLPQAVDADTLFRAASLSKSFAAATALRLEHQGRLHLQDPVTQYTNRVQLATPQATRALTMEFLLSHRTGLPSNSYDKLLEANRPLDELVASLPEVEMVCSVGDCYRYQNIAFNTVSEVMERATGTYFEHLVSDQLFQPLGLTRASFGLDALSDARNVASPHIFRDIAWAPTAAKPNYYLLPAAAGVNLSIRDLNQWMLARLQA
jgi:beta-lactamase class C